MSDTDDGYIERSADETALMERQFKGSGYSGQPYIAPPAKGHDVKGLWHYFPAHTRAGYSAHAIALHKMLLDELHVPTSLIPHRNAALDIDQFPKDRSEMLSKWMADAVGLPEAMIVSLPPDVGMWDLARSLVNYVAGPECTMVSEHARNMVNSDKINALWCVSPFTAVGYMTGGVDPNKVFVVRPPICDGIWRGMFAPLDQIEVPKRDTFVFGTLGTWHERKGFHDLVRAYFKAFRRDQDVELHLRTSTMDSRLTIKKFEEQVIKEIAKIAKDEFGDDNFPTSKRQPKIKLLTGTGLTEQEVVSWIGSLDCFVNPSYGEGLGIPQMWSLAQGVPLVTSNFGAVGEFVAAEGIDNPYVFPSKLVPVPASMRGHSAIWGEDSHWGGYDVDDLANFMLDAARKKERLREAPALVRHAFSYGGCRGLLVQALKKVSRPEILKGWGIETSSVSPAPEFR